MRPRGGEILAALVLVLCLGADALPQLRPETSTQPSKPPAKAARKTSKPGPAQIVVHTSPEAEVYLDDQFEGRASAQGRVVIANPTPGPHKLRVSHPGKRDYEEPVSVTAAQVVEITAVPAEVPIPPKEKPVSRDNGKGQGEKLPPSAPSPPQRIRVGGQVEQAKLIFQPKPEYPPLAKMARIQGVVKMEAVIGKDGTIKDLKVLTGHPLLVKAALEAVSRWRYQPTLFNGESVEVITEIDANFALKE